MKSFQFYFLLKKAKYRSEVIQLLRKYKACTIDETLDKEDKNSSPQHNLLLVYHKLSEKGTSS